MTRDKPRFFATETTNADEGQVSLSPIKVFWVGGMTIATLIGVPLTFSLDHLALFLITCAGVLCFGHSLGMHRRLIHNSFQCPLWLEYIMVYLGTLVGLGGPFTMINTHDMRDWAQRQPSCHDYFAHRRSFLMDGFWQLYCDIKLKYPPEIRYEERIANDRFYHFLERTWMWQQLPWAIVFFTIGGIGWVIWGICARVTICVMGHWLIGHFAHRDGHRHWHVEGAGVQGYNIKFCGLITFGESWHNNHHAFPASAKLGLHQGEADPGWWVLQIFSKMGLIWNLQTPETLAPRKELVSIDMKQT